MSVCSCMDVYMHKYTYTQGQTNINVMTLPHLCNANSLSSNADAPTI